MKIHPVGTKLFHVDKRTDMAKLIARFSQFCEKHLINRTKSFFVIEKALPANQ